MRAIPKGRGAARKGSRQSGSRRFPRHVARRKKGATTRAAYDTLKPAVDAGCFAAADDEATPSNAAPPEAIAYAWLPNDTSTCVIAAGSDDAQDDTDSPACLDDLHPLIRDDLRLRAWLPHRLRVAVAANAQQCSAHCVGASCKPTNADVWSADRNHAALYTRHPTCRVDTRLVQLSADTCVGFDPGAYATPHTDQDAGELTCDTSSATSAARCPAMPVLAQDQAGQIRRFTSSEHSASGDPSTARTVRSTGVNADGTQFALMGESRDCCGHRLFAHRRNLCPSQRPARDREEHHRGLLTGSNRRTNLGWCRLGCGSKPDGISPAIEASTGLLLQARRADTDAADFHETRQLLADTTIEIADVELR